jgi:hypothetical protein
MAADPNAMAAKAALEQLEKGTMPKDHRPETSIQVTNNVNTTIEANIEVNGAGSPKDTGKAVLEVLKKEYKKVGANTPNNIAR